MANFNAPRGFKNVRYADSGPYNGALNPYRLNSGYATNIFCGDAVKLLTTGYLAKANPGDQIRGIVGGFYWVQGSGVPSGLRYWAAGGTTLANADVQVLVYDDPDVQLEAAFTNSALIPAVADIGATFNLFDAGGSPSSGLSGQGVDYSTLNTTAQQFRFVDFVKRSDNDTTSAYSRGLFTPALHDLRVNTGV